MLKLRAAFPLLSLAVAIFLAPVAGAQGADGYSAEAVCAITHARGTAAGYQSSGQAIAAAISNCTANGGIRA